MGKNTSRTRSKCRCPRCEVRKDLCFCHLIPRIRTETETVILMHVCELNLSSNTARLAHQVLENSSIRVRGELAGPMESVDLVRPDGTTFYLFPHDDATPLRSELVSLWPRPFRLIVPDGTWHQAKKIYRRTPHLEKAVKIKLPFVSLSEYRLRTESKESNMSTYEAIVRTLMMLENDASMEAKMMPIFREKMQRTIEAKGGERG